MTASAGSVSAIRRINRVPSSAYCGPRMPRIRGAATSRPRQLAAAAPPHITTNRRVHERRSAPGVDAVAMKGAAVAPMSTPSVLTTSQHIEKYAFISVPSWATTISGTNSGTVTSTELIAYELAKKWNSSRRGGSAGVPARRRDSRLITTTAMTAVMTAAGNTQDQTMAAPVATGMSAITATNLVVDWPMFFVAIMRARPSPTSTWSCSA